MAEPTRIWVAPKLIAFSKSADIPIERYCRPQFSDKFLRSAKWRLASSCNGGSYAAGQTTYNPETMAESSVALMIGVVDSSCKIKISQERLHHTTCF